MSRRQRSKPGTVPTGHARRRRAIALGALALAALAGTARAQDARDEPPPPRQQAFAAFENRLIREVRFEGLERVDPQFVRNQLRTREGQPFRSETITADVQNLYRLGEFGRVEVEGELFEDGAMAVVFNFQERPIVRDVQVVGNVEVSTAEIRDAIAGARLQPGAPYDEFGIDAAARAVERLYRGEGYYAVEVEVDTGELEEEGVVLFRVREGQQAKIARIDFVGNESIETKRLRPEISVRTASWFRDGPFDERKIEDDVSALVQFYRDRGFLDVRADWRVIPSPNGREVILQYLVEEGPRYTLREIKVEGAGGGEPPVLSEAQIVALVEIKPGDVYERPALESSVRAVRDAYWRLGYVDAGVQTDALRAVDEPRVDLLLTVSAGERYRAGEVIIRGNTITKANVIRRRVDVAPDEPLDRVAIEQSERTLNRSNPPLFAQPSPDDPNLGPRVTILPEDPDLPGYRDVLIEVQETNTSSFNFGAAVDTDSGLAGILEARFWNFDIFDTPRSVDDYLSGRSFRGGGQTFSLRASPGTEVNLFEVNFSDPYLFEQDLSGSVGAFLRNREFSDYDEDRRGASLSLGRRFGERWTGSASLRINSVELDDIDPDAPVDVFEVADRNTFWGAGFELTRNTVPAPERFSPGQGTRTSLSIEQVSGDFNFTKLSASHTAFLTIGEDFLGRRQILSFTGRVAYIPQEGESPTYERFFLGGRSFRGFDFRGVSPRGVRNDTGELGSDPVGGDWLFFAGLEFEQPLFGTIPGPYGESDPFVGMVFFVDSGTVEGDIGFDAYRVSVGAGLRIRVPQLTTVPLAFDFGFPVLEEDGDDTRIFSFSIDIPF